MGKQAGTVHFCTAQSYNAAMPRRLEWVESPSFQGFGCSECNWKFSPSVPLTGDSLDEMKRKYEGERDKEFFCPRLCKAPNLQRAENGVNRIVNASPSNHVRISPVTPRLSYADRGTTKLKLYRGDSPTIPEDNIK